MTSFLEGLRILFNFYFLTGIVVMFTTLITWGCIAVFDTDIRDLEERFIAAGSGILVALIFGLCWALFVLAIPLMLCFLIIVLGKKIIFIDDGVYHTRRRNLVRDNFIYQHFRVNDKRKGEDKF